MRNRRITTLGLVVALSLASLSFKCGGGCADNNQLCDAARAADTVAKSIGELTTVKRELARQGKITAAEELRLTQQLLRLNTADRAVVNRLKAMNGAPDADGRQQLLSMFNELTTALDDLNANGVLGLGDADARNRLTTLITVIRGSLPIIQTFLNSPGPAPGGNSNSNPGTNSNSNS